MEDGNGANSIEWSDTNRDIHKYVSNSTRQLTSPLYDAHYPTSLARHCGTRKSYKAHSSLASSRFLFPSKMEVKATGLGQGWRSQKVVGVGMSFCPLNYVANFLVVSLLPGVVPVYISYKTLGIGTLCHTRIEISA
jgi:hypothetical protein